MLSMLTNWNEFDKMTEWNIFLRKLSSVSCDNVYHIQSEVLAIEVERKQSGHHGQDPCENHTALLLCLPCDHSLSEPERFFIDTALLRPSLFGRARHLRRNHLAHAENQPARQAVHRRNRAA